MKRQDSPPKLQVPSLNLPPPILNPLSNTQNLPPPILNIPPPIVEGKSNPTSPSTSQPSSPVNSQPDSLTLLKVPKNEANQESHRGSRRLSRFEVLYISPSQIESFEVESEIEGAESYTNQNLKVGWLGRGYNILDGALQFPIIFNKTKGKFIQGNGAKENSYFFEDLNEYRRTFASIVGIYQEDYIPGMLSRGLLSPKDVFRPFLICPKILNGKEFYVFESTNEFYRIQLHEVSIESNVLDTDKELELLKHLPFNKDTKDMYYGVFDMYGTHFVREVSFGQKGEYSWELDKVSSNKKKSRLKENFKQFFNKWKEANFNTLTIFVEEESFQSQANTFHIIEEKNKIPGDFPLYNHPRGFQIGFQLQPLYTLIKRDNLREEIKKALHQYIRDKAVIPVDDIQNELMVVIKHLDSGNFVRASEEGVFADNLTITKESKFILKKHGDGKVSFRLLRDSGTLNQSYYISKTTLSSTLTVANHLPGTFLGSNFTFVSSGDYLFKEKMFGKAYLRVNPKTKEIFCDSTEDQASRFHVLLLSQFDSLLAQKM